MSEKSIFILCECGLSVLTVRKLKQLGCSIKSLESDLDTLEILNNTNIKSKKKIKRALDEAKKINRNDSLYELYEFGLSETIIKNLKSKISTLEQFAKLNEKNLKRYFNNSSTIQKILDTQKNYFNNKKIELENVNIDPKKSDDYIHIENYYNNMSENKIKEILEKVWYKGEKISSLAQTYNYSRYGMMLLIKRESQKIIAYEDKEYAYIFRKYKWKLEEFCEIFNEKPISYYYLKYKYKIYNEICKNYEELLKNSYISDELKAKIIKYISNN